MAKKRSHDEDGMAAWAGRALIDGTELGRHRAELEDAGPGGRAAAIRISFGRAALAIAGEVGFEETGVERMIERAGSNRARFYGAYPDKEALFSWAYPAALEALVGRLLAAGAAAPDWAAGMRAALVELGRFVAAEPEIARGLLTRPGGAGPTVAAKRAEVVGRLSRAIDRARRETFESRHPVPPFTPTFILGAIETAVLKFLADPSPGDFGEVVPDLLWLAVDLYQGSDAARAQVRALERGD